MWHIMKKGLQNNVVNMIRKSYGLDRLSEQTVYSMAHDMIQFKEFNDGETIVHQDVKSCYNLHYLKSETQAMKNLKNKDDAYLLSQKLT